MKNIIRLTESDLHNIVKKSVGKIINEMGDTSKGQRALGALAQRHALRNPNYDARDTKSKEAEIGSYAEKARGGDKYDNRGNNKNPLYHDYAQGSIDYMNSHPDEYIKHKRDKMSETFIHNIVKETVNRILKEDGIGGTSSFSVNSPAGGPSDPTGQAKNHIDAPAFGGKNKKKVGGNAFSEPIMRQKHNLGDVTQAKANQVDMGETEKRSKDFKNGSMAMQRVGGKKK